MNGVEVAVAGEEDKAAAFDLFDKEPDLCSEKISTESMVGAARFGSFAMEKNLHLERIIEGRGDLPGLRVGSAYAFLERRHVRPFREGCAGEKDGGLAVKKGAAQRLGDAKGG